MKVAIKLINNKVYIDKEICLILDKKSLSSPPYNYKEVEISDVYSDCVSCDFDNNLTFNVSKYNLRKEEEKINKYENEVVRLIRQRYSINQELAILRQRDIKPEEFNQYNLYAEECKAKAKGEANG